MYAEIMSFEFIAEVITIGIAGSLQVQNISRVQTICFIPLILNI